MINALLIIAGAVALYGKPTVKKNGYLEPVTEPDYFESEPFESYEFTEGPSGASDLDKFVEEEKVALGSPFTVGMLTGYDATVSIRNVPMQATQTPAIPFAGESITPYQLTSAYKAYQAVTPPGMPVGFLGYIPGSTLSRAASQAVAKAYSGPTQDVYAKPIPLPAQQISKLSPAQLAYARILGVAK